MITLPRATCAVRRPALDHSKLTAPLSRTDPRECARQGVLECGGGTGSSAFEIARQGGRVVGIDISPVRIAMATERAAAEGHRTSFIRGGRCRTPPVRRRLMDRIVGGAILHHLDLDKAYSEIARALKPGGLAVFVEPMGHNPIINGTGAGPPKCHPDEHPPSCRF